MATTISSGTNPYKLGSPPDFGTLYSGRALEFDGVTDYITVAETLFTGEFTFSAWIYPEALSNEYILTTSDGEDYFNLVDANTTKTKIGNSTDTWDSGAVFVTSKWQHLVLTRDSDNALTIYLDGVSYTSNQPTKSGTFTFQFLGGGNGQFEGKMSNVQLWDKAWSLSDVQYTYTHPERLITDNSAVTSGTTISNLKAWYPCTEGNPRSPQTTVYDGSPKELGSELVVNGGASGQTDWIDTDSDGTADSWTREQTATIVTGNGFTGNAQRIENDGGHSNFYQNSIVSANTVYKLTFKYRANYGLPVYTNSASNLLVELSANTGDAISHSMYFTDASGGELRFHQVNGAGRYFEVDEVSLKEVKMGNHGTTTFVGDELIASDFADNSTFDNDAGNWVVLDTSGGDATAAFSSNKLQVVTTTTEEIEGAQLPIIHVGNGSTTSIVAGRTYRVTVSLDKITPAGTMATFISLGGTATPTFNINETETVYTKDIVPVNNTGALLIYNNNRTATTYTIDAVSVIEVGVATGWTTTDAEPLIPQTALMGMSKPMVFDGVDDRMSASIPELHDNFSLSVWVFFGESADSYQHFISSQDTNTAGRHLSLARSATTNTLYVYASGGQVESDNALPYGKWVHVVLTASGSTTKLYWDGNEEGTDDSSTLDWEMNATTLNIGCYSGGATSYNYFSKNCIVDELSIFNNVALSLVQVQELFNDGVPLDATTHSQSSSLVSYWRNDGASTWTDRSTNSNTATAYGTPDTILLPEGTTTGKDILGFPLTHTNNGWLNLDGTEYVDCGSSSVINFSEFNFTYEAWVKMDDSTPAANVTIIGGGANSYLVVLDTSGYLRFEEKGTGTQTVSTGRITDTDWHHVAVSAHDTDKITFFVDGDEKDTDTYAQLADTNNTYTVGQNGADGEYFKGSIDEVKFYGRALVEAEILKNYKHGKGKHPN